LYRIKKWDYYAILSEKYGITFTIANLGLIVYITWLDFTKKKYYTIEDMKLFTKGKTGLANTPNEEHKVYSSKELFLKYVKSRKQKDNKLLSQITFLTLSA